MAILMIAGSTPRRPVLGSICGLLLSATLPISGDAGQARAAPLEARLHNDQAELAPPPKEESKAAQPANSSAERPPASRGSGPDRVADPQRTPAAQVEVERARLAAAREELADAERLIAELEQRVSAEEPDNVDAISSAITAALEKANVVQQTAKAAQQRMDELRQRIDQPETPATRSEAPPGGAVEDHRSTRESLVDRLLKPFTIENLARWLQAHGPPILTILLGTAIAFIAVRLSGRHLVRLVASTGSRGSLRERENRALTLVGVFKSVATLVVVGGGSLMLLDEAGIPVLPLMGGAAVLGLAVAFGSQNLIKDYFSGFMLLFEDQYGLNDVVKIGDISGAVEQITLRMTVLRDLEGTVHFIPHGAITTVSNMTHGWSRALIEIGVGYKEDISRVMDAMLDVARELRRDETFGPLILDDAEMLGIDDLGDSAVLVKMVIKTHPLKRWPVRREYLRRIKQRFDELGIELPYPHRTLLLQMMSGDQQEPGSLQSSGGKTSGST